MVTNSDTTSFTHAIKNELDITKLHLLLLDSELAKIIGQTTSILRFKFCSISAKSASLFFVKITQDIRLSM